MSIEFNHSAADVVRWALIRAGIGTDPSLNQPWPIFCASEPDIPDNCITVYDTEGVTDGRSMIDGETFIHYGVQIRVRSKDHPVGSVKMLQIRKRISEDSNLRNVHVTIGAYSYYIPCISRVGGINYLGSETPSSRRQIYTLNTLTHVRALST